MLIQHSRNARIPIVCVGIATAGLIGIAATPGTYYFTLQVTSGGITSTLQCQS